MNRKHTIVRVPQRDYVIELGPRRVRYILHLLQLKPADVNKVRIQVDEAHPELEVETTTLESNDFLMYDGSPSEEIVFDHHQRTEAGEDMPTLLRLLPRQSTYPEGISIEQFMDYDNNGVQKWTTLEHPEEYAKGHCDEAMRDPHEGHEIIH